MKSIYRCSTYGFLNIEDTVETDKADIELAALCVNGVYAAALIIGDKKLHIIFNPQKTGLYEVSSAVALIGYQTHLHKANKTAYSFLPYRSLKLSVYYVNSNAFMDALISGLNI